MTQIAITLIGMPGAGKTSLGKALAKKMGYKFLDVDNLVEKKYGKALSSVLNDLGEDEFKKAEEEAVLSIQPQTGIVIATGGSAIYSQSAMIWLKSFSLLFFLNDSLEGLEKRISNMTTRGIVGLKGSFKDLYIERYPLYMEYADEVIEVSPFNKAQIIARIIDLIEYEIQ